MSDSTPAPKPHFRLTLAEGIPLLQKAIEEGRLQLQYVSPATGPYSSGGTCAYHFTIGGKVCGCAIGVMLPPEVAKALPNFTLQALCHYGYLEISESEFPAFRYLQQDHDALFGDVRTGLLTTEEALNHFRNLLRNFTNA